MKKTITLWMWPLQIKDRLDLSADWSMEMNVDRERMSPDQIPVTVEVDFPISPIVTEPSVATLEEPEEEDDEYDEYDDDEYYDDDED